MDLFKVSIAINVNIQRNKIVVYDLGTRLVQFFGFDDPSHEFDS